MKISAAFNGYINNYLIPKGYRPRQIELYQDSARFLIEFVGDKSVSRLTAQEICAYLEHTRATRRLSANSLSNYVSAIRSVLKWLRAANVKCVDYELIPTPKRTPSVRAYLTASEVDCLIENAAGIRGKLIISLLYSAGLRVSELCSLNRWDICDRQFTVLGKGRKLRICFIDDRTEALLQQYLATRSDNDPALIITHLRSRITPVAVQETVRCTTKRAGIEKHVTPHTLRHSFATNFLENNGNLRYLQELLGHADLSTTQVYTHVTGNALRAAYSTYHTI